MTMQDESRTNSLEGMVRLGGVWKSISARGDIYYSGSLGKGLKILILRNKMKQEGSNAPDFEVFLKQNFTSKLEPVLPGEGEVEL